jgi:hypothetical protein
VEENVNEPASRRRLCEIAGRGGKGVAPLRRGRWAGLLGAAARAAASGLWFAFPRNARKRFDVVDATDENAR